MPPYGPAKPAPVNVLLVEDDEVDAKAILRSFRQSHIANRVERARDGIEALAALRGSTHVKVERPHIVLLDIHLPRMTGLEFLAHLRADSELHDTIVFVLSSSRDESDRDVAYQHNVAGYIVKSKAGPEFLELNAMLGAYWRLVELPN